MHLWIAASLALCCAACCAVACEAKAAAENPNASTKKRLFALPVAWFRLLTPETAGQLAPNRNPPSGRQVTWMDRAYGTRPGWSRRNIWERKAGLRRPLVQVQYCGSHQKRPAYVRFGSFSTDPAGFLCRSTSTCPQERT